MRSWFAHHRSFAVRIALIVGVVVLLLLLSLGIANEDIIATMISGAGLAVVIVIGGTILLVPDTARLQATERTLMMASNTLEHVRGGLNAESCNIICQLLLPETSAAGVAITDTEKVVAYAGELPADFPPGSSNTAPTREVLGSKRVETFVAMDSSDQNYRPFILGAEQPGRSFGIIVPLLIQDRAVGTIKLYYHQGVQIDRTQLAIAKGLGELLSTQLSAYELDRQAELTARAEVKALQAQINPHFLFNSLNTIASLTRTDPTKARDLLREFSVYFRRTLDNPETSITLSSELEQTLRYLNIEKARFGEDRIIVSESVQDGCGDVLVPAFLVQPIVENAVRHAMRDEGPLHIAIDVATDASDILVSVTDDGMGMDEEVAASVLEETAPPSSTGGGGAGIALKNVAERVQRFFGEGSGVDIVSKLGEGTCVTLRLGGAAKLLAERDADAEASETANLLATLE